MTVNEMMQQSLILTLLGMIIVFAFLWIMILCVDWVGKLIRLLGWDKDLAEKKEKPKAAGGPAKPEITAAIVAAVTEHRNKGQGQHE
jgi:oxaloacetate decarboxylase gamma subunit